MIITTKFGKYTLQEAVSQACDGQDYERGKLETIEASLRYTQDILAKVMAEMHPDVVKRALEASGKVDIVTISDES